MIRIAVPWLISISDKLEAVQRLPESTKMREIFFQLFDLKNHLEALYDFGFYGFHLRTSRPKAADIIKILDPLLERDLEQDVENIWQIKYEVANFKPLFLADLSVLPVFLTTMKESYDVNLLVEAGFTLFPPQMRMKVPEASTDAAEAGKALAFELGTACGFHTFRVAESVLRKYWTAVSGSEEPLRLQTIGAYAAELENKQFGDTKVREALKQLARLHRNPIIHPEVILSTEEAIGIIGMVRSVVGSMLTVIPDAPNTTTTPVPPDAKS